MFTGLIEDVGAIESLRAAKRGVVLMVKTALPLREMELGASIAVNGACLTVIKKKPTHLHRGCLTGDAQTHRSGNHRTR